MKKIIIEFDENAAYNTSFHYNTVITSKDKLIEKFGLPTWSEEEIWDKVQSEWSMKITIDNKTICGTIYDWKEYRQYPSWQNIEWHIGATTKDDSLVVAEIVSNMLNDSNEYSIEFINKK